MSEITLLAIETSCDETGVAIVRKVGDKVEVLAQAIASQIDIHKETGGVVPEVAAREHVTVLRPLLEKVMHDAKVTNQDLTGIAVTVGPGLQPALAVGVTAARSLAYAWNKPVVPVNHLEGHIYSALLLTTNYVLPTNLFPALALIVSGGHTLLVKVTSHVQYKILGATQDDAVGEAFDKVARLLGLPYPGGARLSALAKTGDPKAFSFPRPMAQSRDLNFSFSGLKTAVLYAWRDSKQTEEVRRNIAASFEAAAVEALVVKAKQAIQKEKYQCLLVGGGVAANEVLRKQLKQIATDFTIPLSISPLELCGDNAVMIGAAGLFAYEAGRRQDWSILEPHAQLSLEAMNHA